VGVVNLQDFIAAVVDDPDGDFAGLRWVESPAPADFNHKLRTNVGLKKYSHISTLCHCYLPHIPWQAFSFPIAGQTARL
jgi:hypothetical protein